MKLIIAGSRSIEDYQILLNAFNQSPFDLESITEIVSGGAKGVDLLGERFAEQNSIPIKRFIPYWYLYGKYAGMRRNEEMGCYADALLAIHDGKSKGTKHMINFAKNKKLKVFTFSIFEIIITHDLNKFVE